MTEFAIAMKEVVLGWLTMFWEFITSSINSAISLFYDATNSEFTIIGILALFGLAVGLVYLGLNFVMRLIRK